MPFLTQGKTNWNFLLIVVVLAVIVGGGILAYQYWWIPKEEVKNTQKPVACIQELRLCPDGSWVGNTGPNCEFAPCPTTNTDETADWQTYRNEEYGIEIKYVTDLSNIGAVVLDRKVPNIQVIGNNFYPAGVVDENNCISPGPLPIIFTKKLTINRMKFCMTGTWEKDIDGKVILYYNYTTKKDDNYFLFEFDIKALETPCDFSQANQKNCFDRNKAEAFFENILSTFKFID